MKRILILGREDLVEDKKLIPLDGVTVNDFSACVHLPIKSSDVCIMQCFLSNKQRILKHRYAQVNGKEIDKTVDGTRILLD